MQLFRVICAVVAGLAVACLAPGAGAAPSRRSAEAEVRNLTARSAAAAAAFRLSEAWTLGDRAYSLGVERLGPDDPVTLEAGRKLVRGLAFMNRPLESRALSGRLLAAAQARLGPLHPTTLRIRQDLMDSMFDTRSAVEREPALRQLVDDVQRVFGPKGPETSRALAELARLYDNDSGQLDLSACEGDLRAMDYYRRALVARGDRLDPENFLELLLNGALAELEDKRPDCAEREETPEEARIRRARTEPYYRAGLRDLARAYGSANRLTLAARASFAVWLRRNDRAVDAERLRGRVAAAIRNRYGPNDPALIELELDFVSCVERVDCRVQRTELGRRAAAYDASAADPYGQYVLLALAYRFDDAPELSDAILGAAAEGRLRAVGPSEAIGALGAQYRLRRKTPSLAGTAIAPARRRAQALTQILTTGGTSLSASRDSDAREADAISGYFDLAEAAWAARGGAEPVVLREEAYAALQRATAGSVNRALAISAAQRAADDRGGGLSELARRRAALVETWATLDAEISRQLGAAAAAGAALPQETIRRREAAERDVKAIDERLQVDFPDYFAFLHPEPVDLAATQAMLRPDEALLVAIPGDSGVQLVAVSHSDVAWHRAGDASRLKASVDRLLGLAGADVGVNLSTELKWQQEAGPGLPYDRRRAFEIYQQLIAPVAGVLKGKRQVFIVSGGWLSRLPFGILVAEAPAGADADPAALRATTWFADQHAISVVPSVRALQLLRSQARRTEAQGAGVAFVGFGDPKLDGRTVARGGRGFRSTNAVSVFRADAEDRPAGEADVAALRRLERLPGTAVELENMRALFGAPPSDIYLAERATETAVKAVDLSRVRVLAFATHGLVSGELRGESEPGLVLTPPAFGTRSDDGLLTASEVAALSLGADWVILSACNTAAGDGRSASGLSGLARAFFHAGARALLVSHWPVRDDVASRLTVEAIRLQRETPSVSRAEALQQAIRRIRDDPTADVQGDTWAHPNAWAPFSLVGDGAETAFRQ